MQCIKTDLYRRFDKCLMFGLVAVVWILPLRRIRIVIIRTDQTVDKTSLYYHYVMRDAVQFTQYSVRVIALHSHTDSNYLDH